MIRAVFFDFYSVWTPDKLSYYLAYAELMGPVIYKELYDAVEKYYQGDMTLEDLSGTIRYKLGANDISADTFKLSPNSISPEITKFMQGLHGHFVKVCVFGNLGPQEYTVLKRFNDAHSIIEVIVSPFSLNLKKPLLDQEVFIKAFEAVGEAADSCLLVSGNPYYLAYASLMGAQTLLFEGLAKLENDIDQVISSDTPTDKTT